MNGSVRRTVATLLCLAWLAACIPIPLINPEPYRDETVGALESGTTRADVLFALGAPNFAHEDDSVFVYVSDEYEMAFIFVLGAETAGAVGAGAVAQRFLLVVEFDSSGRIHRREVLDLGLGMPSDDGMEFGYDDIVCTTSNLCFMHSGAILVSDSDDVVPPDGTE